MLRFLAGFATALVVLAVVAVLLIFTGAYNVAASVPHSDIEFTILHTVMRNSVIARAPAESRDIWSEEEVRRELSHRIQIGWSRNRRSHGGEARS